MHIFKSYNENHVLIHEYKNLKCNAGDNLKDNLNHIDLFYVKLMMIILLSKLNRF